MQASAVKTVKQSLSIGPNGTKNLFSVGFNGSPPLQGGQYDGIAVSAEEILNLGGNTDFYVRPKLLWLGAFFVICILHWVVFGNDNFSRIGERS